MPFTYKLIDNTFSLENSFNIISFEEQYDLLEDEEYNNGETISFIFGVLKEGYYRIIGLNIDPTIKVYFSKDIFFKGDLFILKRGIQRNVWKRILSVTNQRAFYIGGSEPKSWTIDEYTGLIKSFPNNTEIYKYIDRETSKRITNFVDIDKNYSNDLDKYIGKLQV
ncbi:hypothetical protein A7322_12150 [Lentilactobacillus parabuchneri]|uniref:hypothetical protein n=1 Tax=Lentilactobacillus parabuchneri TaxID=152331 RepID=UPI00080BB0B3|nr:hypothetical protein [Lentilactobacillus parabuchneri]OCB80829.1 hypothetical protein A7322_12150 [Lentilactobacillus parabuchneri]